jgi:ornithine decarboxylase
MEEFEQDHHDDDAHTPSLSSESDSSAYEVQEGIRLHFSIDPLTAKPVVQVEPQDFKQKKKRRKRSKEKKKAYDKAKKTTGTQAAKHKERKTTLKKAKRKENQLKREENALTKNARKRLIRKQAFGVQAVANVEEVLDKAFGDAGHEIQVRDLQLKVKSLMERINVPLQVLPTTEKLDVLLEKKVKQKKQSAEDAEASQAFFLLDLGTIVRKYVQWVACFPRVHPFYAVKCNPDIVILHTIAACGGCFDCASVAEIKLAMSVGASPENIIFANPCKPAKSIEFAAQQNVTMTTFDNIIELEKIHSIYPQAKLVLRILGDDTYSLMAFGSKFGCTVPEESTLILQKAAELKANVVGVSFHVGSWCTSSKAFIKTLELARSVFDTAKNLGFNFNLLDIGGGWPGFDTEELSFKDIAAPIQEAIDELFDKSVRVIAEPGRYFVAECAVLATSIIARRERLSTPNDPRIVERTDTPVASAAITPTLQDGKETGAQTPQKTVSYYLADGVYGSFNNIFFDHAVPRPNVLPKRTEDGHLVDLSQSPHESTLFGPTCDSVDVIAKNIHLPSLESGDWLYFLNMGAYTTAASSTFNGVGRPPVTYIMTEPEPEQSADGYSEC